jgi:ankyrin repeat protein
MQDNNGNTALHFAIYVDNRSMAAKLLEHHADIEIKNKVCVTQV